MKLFCAWVARIASYIAIILLVGGSIKLPTLPIKLCNQGYCDKMGNVVTRDIYNLYVIWEKFFFISVATLFISLIILMLIQTFDKRGRLG